MYVTTKKLTVKVTPLYKAINMLLLSLSLQSMLPLHMLCREEQILKMIS